MSANHVGTIKYERENKKNFYLLVPLPNLPAVTEKALELPSLAVIAAGRAIDDTKDETRIPATKRLAPAREATRKAEMADMVSRGG